MNRPGQTTDGDARKGSVEKDQHEGRTSDPKRPDIHGNLSDQLPHRKSGDLNGADTDFPEPGSNPEHSGQKGN